MDLDLRWEDGHRLLLTCSGELGWNSIDVLTKKVGEALEGRRHPQVLLNLEAVDFITSAGIGGLLQLRKLVGDRAGQMAMACAAPLIVQLFKTVGLDRHVPMLDTLDEARRLLGQPDCEAVPK